MRKKMNNLMPIGLAMILLPVVIFLFLIFLSEFMELVSDAINGNTPARVLLFVILWFSIGALLIVMGFVGSG
jgi:hypothetical protein